MANYFIIKDDTDKARLIKFIDTLDLVKPKKISCINYVRDRSKEQNELQMLWYQVAERQFDGNTFDDLRSICKLQFGIPILRRDNDDFREIYDRLIRPLSYEDKLKYIAVFDLPVTRLMNIKQMVEFTERIAQYFSEKGVYLPLQTERTFG